ncbi:MAG: MFS transporter [Rhizobiaceae bacterium]|nr:MFS transporter [Rhizobiaceae bacterium]
MTDDAPPFQRPLKQRSVWGWMAFDFAAQPFFTVVVTFIFGPYIVSQMADDPAQGQVAWGIAAGIAGLVIALLSPVLGAIADRAGPRKPFIAAFACLKVAALCGLWFAAPGTSLFFALALLVTAQVAAEFSIVFNDAMLPTLVARQEIGRVSNIGWGLGFLGGMIVLFATVGLLAGSPDTGLTLLGLPPLFGLDPAAGEGARATAPLSALWYVVFVLPMFLLVPDRAAREAIGPAIRDAGRDLKATFREIRTRRPLFRFMLARMIYQDGVNGLLVLGGAFAAGMFGWTVTEIGVFGILLNVTAILGCLAASAVDSRLGSKVVVSTSILILVVATLGIVSTEPSSTLFGLLAFSVPTGAAPGLFATPAEQAYLGFGLLVGLSFGPIQASSRSWLAQSVTPDEAGRYFGFYALTGRATSFLAPLSVSALTAVAVAFTDPVTASRIGMSALIAFFVVGLMLLAGARYPAARE